MNKEFLGKGEDNPIKSNPALTDTRETEILSKQSFMSISFHFYLVITKIRPYWMKFIGALTSVIVDMSKRSYLTWKYAYNAIIKHAAVAFRITYGRTGLFETHFHATKNYSIDT